METRGRKGVARHYYSTSGSREVSTGWLEDTLSECFPEVEVSNEALEPIRGIINARLTEIDNPYWSWKQAKREIEGLQKAAMHLVSAIDSVRTSGGGQNLDMPHGFQLLEEIRSDYDDVSGGNGAPDWPELELWLSYLAAQLPKYFVDHGLGKADPYRWAIRGISDALACSGVRITIHENSAFLKFLAKIDHMYEESIYPGDRHTSNRSDYVRNAIRRNIK